LKWDIRELKGVIELTETSRYSQLTIKIRMQIHPTAENPLISASTMLLNLGKAFANRNTLNSRNSLKMTTGKALKMKLRGDISMKPVKTTKKSKQFQLIGFAV